MTRVAARRLAALLERRGLAEPGRLLADAHRPLAPLLGDLAAAYGPLARLAGPSAVGDLQALLEDPRGLDHLAEELREGPSRGRRAKSG